MDGSWWRFLLVHRYEIVAVGAGIAVLEALFLLRRSARAGTGRAWTLKESLANIFILWVGQGSRMLTFAWRYAVFAMVHSISPFRIETTLLTTVVCYVALDCIYYWKHRLLHETAFGWSMHSVHHSSTELNLTTSIRSSWIQRLVDDFFYLPLSLIGFSPLLVLVIADVNLFSQFWIHTRVIGRLGPLEWFLNTPSSHRVHHARARPLADKNYGSTLIIWDRLFGTYAPEPTPEPDYGTELGFLGHDPVTVQLAGHLAYFRSRKGSKQTNASPGRGGDVRRLRERWLLGATVLSGAFVLLSHSGGVTGCSTTVRRVETSAIWLPLRPGEQPDVVLKWTGPANPPGGHRVVRIKQGTTLELERVPSANENQETHAEGSLAGFDPEKRRVLLTPDGEKLESVAYDEIAVLTVIGESPTSRHVGNGALIGGLTGAAVGGVSGAAVGGEFRDACALGFGFSGGVVGAGLGSGAGAIASPGRARTDYALGRKRGWQLDVAPPAAPPKPEADTTGEPE